MSASQFEIVTTTSGAISIRDNQVGEIMHNPVGPWIEANALYIEQSGLKERLESPTSNPLIIFDIGLGAATNAIAAIRCIQKYAPNSSLQIKIISFEKNTELLQFTLDHSLSFEHLAGFEVAMDSLLKKQHWTSGPISWELRHGDFRDCIDREQERPHIIFFDPYSPKVNQEMWTQSIFEKLYRKCRHEQSDHTVLLTYSQATPIRSALLASGFFVGHGKKTGLKEETTIASTQFSSLKDPLGARWMSRWTNSQSPYPTDCTLEQIPSFKQRIMNHKQFSNRVCRQES